MGWYGTVVVVIVVAVAALALVLVWHSFVESDVIWLRAWSWLHS